MKYLAIILCDSRHNCGLEKLHITYKEQYNCNLPVKNIISWTPYNSLLEVICGRFKLLLLFWSSHHSTELRVASRHHWLSNTGSHAPWGKVKIFLGWKFRHCIQNFSGWKNNIGMWFIVLFIYCMRLNGEQLNMWVTPFLKPCSNKRWSTRHCFLFFLLCSGSLLFTWSLSFSEWFSLWS